MTWTEWISGQWPVLASGQKIVAPLWLSHPSAAGFRPIGVATPSGQCADWGLPYPDGSRVHVHEFVDGRIVVHRDRFDPDAGPLSLLAHLLGETFVGPVLVGVLVFAAARGSKAV